MNDLQLSLLLIGIVVIIAVVLYNAWQERRFRRLAQSRFQSQRDDVLFGTPAPTVSHPAPAEEGTRIEPTVSTPPETLADEETPVATSPERASGCEAAPPEADAEIDCLVRLTLAEPAAAITLRELVSDARFGKPVRWFGCTASGEWQTLGDARDSAEFSVVVGSLQLADRAGAVEAESVERFRRFAQELGERLSAVAELPETASTLARAKALDEFCAEVDVLVGINVVAMGQASFAGTKLRALAEAAGLRLAADGTFQYQDEEGQVLYALANQETAPFAPESMRHLTTHGVTLLFDVPRVAGGLAAFDQMMGFARHLAEALGGRLVDDNLRPLTDEGIARIRNQLAALYAKMDARGIPAGAARALRLFS